MKKLVYKLAVFSGCVALLLVSYFSQPSAEINNRANIVTATVPDTQFQIGAFNCGNFSLYNYIHDSLGFNIWHQYTSLDTGWNHDGRDNYLAPITQYEDSVISRVGNNDNHNLRTYFDRPIVEYIVAGQRTDYQCETASGPVPYCYWGYNHSLNYDTIIVDDTDIRYGADGKVKHCKSDINHLGTNACWIDSGLIANRNLSLGRAANYWNADNSWKWYVMPRIRIDSAYAADLNHLNDTVCRIKITGWNGNVVKDIGILVENFKYNLGDYHGNYLDTFYYYYGQDNLFLDIATINANFVPDSMSWTYDWSGHPCKMDIKIYWAGKCDAWFDRVRLENVPAHRFLTLKESWITDKVNAEIGWANNNKQIPNYFYFEECQLSHFPCIAALNKQIMDNSSPANSNGLMIWLNYLQLNEQLPNFWGHLLTAEQLKTILFDTCGLRTMVTGWYPFEGWTKAQWLSRISYHPTTLLSNDYDSLNGILSYETDPISYDSWLQNLLDADPSQGYYFYSKINRVMDSLSRISSMRVIYCPQAHLWYWPSSGTMQKEPSNEELELQTDLALTYNAKGIMYFSFDSWGDFTQPSGNYARGIMNASGSTLVGRDSNVYNQNKFAKIKELSAKLKKWGPYLMSFDPQKTQSFICRTERNIMINNSYIADVISYKPGDGGTPACVEEQPMPNMVYDCPEDRYIQTATFEPYTGTSVNQYFMILNRRCSPFIDATSENNNGGRRYMRVKFKPNTQNLAGFLNWNIKNVENDSLIGILNSGSYTYIDLGWFKPGEGKLYKITPLAYEGGTMVCDESFLNKSFTCNGIINNNGYNLTIGRNCTITFDTGAGIVMNGGSLYCGEMNHSTTLQAKSGMTWKGISCSDCEEVCIRNTTINGVNPDKTSDGILSLSDCNYIAINNNTINSPYQAQNGIINVNSIDVGEKPEVSISENTINEDFVSSYTIAVNSEGSLQIPVYIQNNNITANNNGSAVAVFLTNISVGIVSDNTIDNFLYGVILYSSSADIGGNNIISSGENSMCIGSYASSTANLNPSQSVSGLYYNGGGNYLRTNDNNSNNLYVNDSYFNIDKGGNIFEIPCPSTNHLSGWFPSGTCEFTLYYARDNCYKVNGQEDNVFCNVTCGDGGQSALFYFGENSCNSQNYDGMDVIAISEDITDTVRTSSIGGGSFSNVQLPIDNVQLRALRAKNILSVISKSDVQTDALSIQRIFKQTRDSININMRKRNYDAVINQCTYMLNTFPDSTFSIDALSKLYASSLRRDSAGSKMSPLKTYFETLILNNADNSVLIARANYFVQKCKVSLKQYTSAMQGFQEIMNQFPYSYEGLVASWDYAATQLLANSGGGFANEELKIKNEELESTSPLPPFEGWKEQSFSPFTFHISQSSDVSHILNDLLDTLNKYKVGSSYINGDYDKSKFSKKDRQLISSNIQKSFNNEKVKQINKIKELENSSKSKNEVTSSKAKSELKKMKTLGDVVKVKRPKDIKEHINIINSDIKKVFGTDKTTGAKDKKNQLPNEYKLYQNFPNPFNPLTKINYDLPKDAKVSIVIYDILGRQMLKLVNDEFQKAGRYSLTFNGQPFASGVYFYRLVSDKYVEVKKMVLIK